MYIEAWQVSAGSLSGDSLYVHRWFGSLALKVPFGTCVLLAAARAHLIIARKIVARRDNDEGIADVKDDEVIGRTWRSRAAGSAPQHPKVHIGIIYQI